MMSLVGAKIITGRQYHVRYAMSIASQQRKWSSSSNTLKGITQPSLEVFPNIRITVFSNWSCYRHASKKPTFRPYPSPQKYMIPAVPKSRLLKYLWVGIVACLMGMGAAHLVVPYVAKASKFSSDATTNATETATKTDSDFS